MKLKLRKTSIPICALIFLSGLAYAQDDVTSLAESDQPVIIYLHGQIVEEKGPTPVHPRWGLYDYPAVVDALGSKGASVISEARERGTDVVDYAARTVKLVESLISDGVAPERIVVVGFSKGGAITIHVSSSLGRPEVRYVTLAACGGWLSTYPELQFSGHVFSVWEKSDPVAGSCRKLVRRSPAIESFREKRIATGKEHGAFYLPKAEWVDPVLNWIHDRVEP